MDLSKLSNEELIALLNASQGQPTRPKGTIDNSWAADELPWWKQAFAGGGKAAYDFVRGVGELLPGNVVSRKDVDESKKRDEALMNTGWGMTGNVLGNLLPAALVPASSIPRAVATGMGMGLIQPVGEKESRTENTIIGGAVAPVVPALVGGARIAKGLMEPVVAPNRTAARVLSQFADDPDALAKAAMNAREIIPGSKPTLAQAAMQPGISTLERSMANQPGPLQKALSDRVLEQNAARKSFLDDMAGADGRLDFQKAARSATAEEQYAKAFAEVPEDSAWIKGELKKLGQRPAFAEALKEGQTMAADSGIKVSIKNPENATQILHFTKMALDDKIEAAVRAGNGNRSRALIDTRDKLVSLMESKGFSPSYREARDTFKQMSGPINEMETAAALRSKLIPAIEDGVDAPARMNPNSFAAEVRKRSDDIARMSPDFQGKLGNLSEDIGRKVRAEGMGKPTGSPTAQYLTAQNLMRQVAGPMGLPQGFADKAAQTVMATPVVGSALSWATKGAEARVQAQLAEMLMNPKTAAAALEALQKNPALAAVASKSPQIAALMSRAGSVQNALTPYAPGLMAGGMFAANR